MNERLLLIVVCLLLGTASRAGGAPLVQYSQNGVNYIPFSVITGREKARNYYDYRNNMGHPDFGLVAGATTAALYYDSKRDALSLIVISGGGTDNGQVSYGFKNLPLPTYLTLADERNELSYKKGTATATGLFNWRKAADGVVFSGLEDIDFNIRVALKPFEGVTSFRLAAANGTFIPLDLNRPLYLATQSVGGGVIPPTIPPDGGNSGTGSTPPPVPEPSGTVLLGAALLGLLKRRPPR